MKKLILIALLSAQLIACGKQSTSITQNRNTVSITILDLHNPQAENDQIRVSSLHPSTVIESTRPMNEITFIQSNNCLLERGVFISDLVIQGTRATFQYRDHLNQPLTYHNLTGCILTIEVTL